MKRNLWFSLFLFFSVVIINEAVAQKMYISPAGDDANPGTAEQPLATLTAARDGIRLFKKQNPSYDQPLQIIVQKGDYLMPETLELTPEDGGSPSAPLVFKGEEDAVLYGGKYLNRFTKVSDHLWKIEVPEVKQYGWQFEQLFVNGVRATRARTPDDDFFNPVSVKETVIVRGSGRAPELAVQQIKIPADAAKWLKDLDGEALKKAVVVFYHHWDNTKKPVQFYNPADTSIYISGEGMKPWNAINASSTFYIENILSALDTPGEWYLEPSGTLYYYPRPGETIETATAMAPVLEKFITITGSVVTGEKVRNIRFENLDFRVTGYRMPPDGVEPAQSAAPVAAAIEMDFASNIIFANCEVSGTGGSGIWFRRACDNGLIEHCYLHDLGAGAVKIGETMLRDDPAEVTNHIRVVNNIARSGGHVFPCAAGMIIFHGSDNELLHNDIADFKYTGVSVGWVWGYTPSPSKRNRIEYNHIHHLGWGVLSDMGGVYTLGASEGTTVSNNVIHHIYSLDYGGWGLYTDEGSAGIIMENNLVYNCKSAGFHQHYGKDNIIRNNIFVNSIKSQLQATRVEDHLSFSFTNNILYYNGGPLLSSSWSKVNMLSDYNCYWNGGKEKVLFGTKTFAEWQKEGKDKHSVIADPGFTGVQNFDFRLKNRKVAQKIKFRPFDYSKAGVYGSDAWVQKARLEAARLKLFDEMVQEHERKTRK